jgi:hypothetical protein
MFLRESPEGRWCLGGSGHRGRGQRGMPAGHTRAALRAAVALESPWQQRHPSRHSAGNGRQGAEDSMARRGPRLMMLHGTLRRRVPGHSVDMPLSILPNYYTTVAPYSEHHRTMIAVTQVCSDEYMHPRYWSLQREQSAALQREEPHAAHGPSGCPPQPLQTHPPHCVQLAQSRHGDCGPRQGIPVTSTPNREASCTHDKQRPCWHTSHV